MDEKTFIEMSNKIEDIVNEYGWHLGTLCHHKSDKMLVWLIDGTGLEINGELVYGGKKV